MTKSPYDYNVYTPELISELKKLTAGLPRAEAIKRLEKRLNVTLRSARRQYVKYIENGAEPTVVNETYFKAKEEGLVGRKIKRLFYDIETSPNIGLFWKAGFKLNIGADSIIRERAIICIGYKWEDEKETHVLHWDKNQDDKEMLAKFLEIAAEADELIGHNIDHFDMPWVKTRCLFHGLEPLPMYKTVDTLQWARSKFYFNSNRLDYVAKYLKIGGKIKTEFNLWKDILLNKCPIAMEKMCEYCKFDVVLLQEVWERLSKVMPAKTHVGVLNGKDKWTSPYDGSENVHCCGTRVTAAGGIKKQMQCNTTGRYYTISASSYEDYLAAKRLKS